MVVRPVAYLPSTLYCPETEVVVAAAAEMEDYARESTALKLN